ncbi:MAG: universal stress protein [Candidatus Falkowbacteria bacterium]
MKKILIPVDFSGHTDITCKYALEFARVYGAEIKLFHTYFDQIIIADTSFPDTLDMSTMYNEELMKEIHHQAMRNMEELSEKVTEMIKKENLSNVTLSSNVTGGEIEHELKEFCHEFRPDLVVMGTTGKGNNINVWGKVSTFIIDHAKVPVLTVPELKSYRGIKSLMFAADLSEANPSSISGILELFAPFNCKLHVVHFITKSKNSDAFDRMKALQMKFGKEEKAGQIIFEVIEYTDDNQKVIDLFVHERNIDIIAFQPHKRSLLYMVFTKNITKKNLFATNIPLLAVPTHE